MKPSLTVATVFLVGVAFLPSCKQGDAVQSESQHLPEREVGIPVSGSSETKSEDGPASVAAYANYRSWHKANPEPVRMNDIVAWMCRSLTPAEATKLRGELESPHDVAQEWKTFTVFVNHIGKERLVGTEKGEFPIGTIIVKEKHDGNDPSTSELLTVMIKRERGFAPEIGDWEFVVLDGFAKAVQKGSAETCISCHTGEKANDYVFADYLPKD